MHSPRLLANTWRDGKDLDLPSLIQLIQNPPFQRVGVIDLESFYPAKDRFALAMQINTLMAAPGFEQWLQGEPLDAATLLYGAAGKPRVSVVSIAHLGDAERMFVVTLLLNQVVAWMRAQSGTTSLRAIIYMDEIAGYFPPVANPPSKAPLLTLMKQARAFGIGVLLGTQNTVDLDYKGLANAGHVVPRTPADRAGQGARARRPGRGGGRVASIERDADRTLSALGKRVFLLHDIHEEAPRTFQTRWSMSYLRGPAVARSDPYADELRAGRRRARRPLPRKLLPAAAARQTPSPTPRTDPARPRRAPPVVPPEVKQLFVPGAASGDTYQPVALGRRARELRRREAADQRGERHRRRRAYRRWRRAGRLVRRRGPRCRARRRSPPSPERASRSPRCRKAAATAKNYAAWQKSFASWVADGADGSSSGGTPRCSSRRRSGESERDFRIRVQNAQREARDAEVESVRQKFAAKRAALEEKLRRAEQGVTREQQQATSQKLQTAVSIGATVIGALFGRKAISAGTIGRATTAARGFGRSAKEMRGCSARAAERRGDATGAGRPGRTDHRADEGHRRALRRGRRERREGRRRPQARPGARCSSSRWDGRRSNARAGSGCGSVMRLEPSGPIPASADRFDALSATIGSTDAARLAGIRQATTATIMQDCRDRQERQRVGWLDLEQQRRQQPREQDGACHPDDQANRDE